MGEMSGRVENAIVAEYGAFLIEQYRPPSRGGNTSAMHQHSLLIDGQRYTFLARGAKKWVYKADRVTFDWRLAKDKYRNIDVATLKTTDKNGVPVVRGDRRSKQTWRTAPPRMPASRREQRD
jgi:hypothetical protein